MAVVFQLIIEKPLAMGNGSYIIFFDYSKAFDAIDHRNFSEPCLIWKQKTFSRLVEELFNNQKAL